MEDFREAYRELFLQDIKNSKEQLPDTMSILSKKSKYRTQCIMVLEMKKNGCSITQIAEYIGIPRKEVKKMLREYSSVSEVNRNGN